MDCLIKHHHMIVNPHYGVLGLVKMCYQLMVELLGPVFWIIDFCWLMIIKKMIPFFSIMFIVFVLAQIGITILAAYMSIDKNKWEFFKLLPKLILTTVEGMFLQFPIMLARLFGMITFHWRKLVW